MNDLSSWGWGHDEAVSLRDWNVVVTLRRPEGYQRVRHLLGNLGVVGTTRFYNVLVMRATAVLDLVEALSIKFRDDERFSALIARVAPAVHTFDFADVPQFDDLAATVVRTFAPRLEGASFHTRLHRRGHRKDLPSIEVEQRLNAVVVSATQLSGAPARIDFDDPDFVVPIDTVDLRAGVAVWSREEMARHPFLHPDR